MARMGFEAPKKNVRKELTGSHSFGKVSLVLGGFFPLA